ncbi:hypothetical protein M8332_07040 (plasmid) [Fructilactobacillus ixorae]|uniref:Uncharacterized protein n=1 Tax=Fructilactobacillus ixorae TaxID=1750535 RepID=A0ABY5C6B5_9LACO|nr:hypothetical protein [Fructilactobacillus ixorae]USS93971.1 hypothetical protein M8332_07040 [Fructilactobacillus ixorae]
MFNKKRNLLELNIPSNSETKSRLKAELRVHSLKEMDVVVGSVAILLDHICCRDPKIREGVIEHLVNELKITPKEIEHARNGIADYKKENKED